MSIDKNRIFIEIQSCLFSGRHVSYPQFFKYLYFSPPSEAKKAKDITGLPQSITHFVLSLCYTNDESCSISRTNKYFGNNTSVSCGRWELTKSFIWDDAFSEKCWINSLPVEFCAILKERSLQRGIGCFCGLEKESERSGVFVVVVLKETVILCCLHTVCAILKFDSELQEALLYTGIIFVRGCVCEF